MTTTLERMRELAGIVESRPAYKFLGAGEVQFQAEIDEQANRLTGDLLEAEVARLAELCVQLEQGKGEEDDEDGPVFNPDLSPEKHHAAANLQHKMARKHKLLRRADKSTARDHTDVDNSTHGSDTHAGSREQRNHAAAAFHHKHAARLYGAAGETHKAKRHDALAHAHQRLAGHHRVDPDPITGRLRVGKVDNVRGDFATLHPEKKKKGLIKRPVTKLPSREPEKQPASKVA